MEGVSKQLGIDPTESKELKEDTKEDVLEVTYHCLQFEDDRPVVAENRCYEVARTIDRKSNRNLVERDRRV